MAAGGGKEFGAIGGTTVGEEALNANAVGGVEGDGLAESIESTGDLLVWQQTGEGQAAVIIDGDVQSLDAVFGCLPENGSPQCGLAFG